MNKTDLARDIKSTINSGFITRQQLAVYMGYSDPHAVDRYLHGLQKFGKGRYFVFDVAEALMQKGI